MTKILAFSGKKQSGKNSAANQLIAIELTQLGIVQGEALITPKGQILVTDILGKEIDGRGILDLDRRDNQMFEFKAQYLDPFIKTYSFADILKGVVCMGILGLTHEQCYGTDEEKNSLTNLYWENMPGVVSLPLNNTDVDKVTQWVSEVANQEELDKVVGRLGEYYTKSRGFVFHEPGQMSAREVMQFVGTEVFRKMYADVWADATIRRIQAEAPMAALITDCRFPNEVAAVQKTGGTVIRFDRDVYKGQDQHESETALDPDKFDWNRFDIVIKNHDMNLLEQMEALYTALVDKGLYEPLEIVPA